MRFILLYSCNIHLQDETIDPEWFRSQSLANMARPVFSRKKILELELRNVKEEANKSEVYSDRYRKAIYEMELKVERNEKPNKKRRHKIGSTSHFLN